MKDNVKKVIAFILLILIIGVFLIINIFSEEEKRKIENTTTTVRTTQAKPKSDYSDNQRTEYIVLEGMREAVTVQTYHSSLGVQVDYDIAYFTPNRVSNKELVFVNNYDNTNYVSIESVSESLYFKEYESYENDEMFRLNSQEENYSYSYKFLRGNGVYFIITKKIKNDFEYKEGLSIRMDHLINSLYITQKQQLMLLFFYSLIA